QLVPDATNGMHRIWQDVVLPENGVIKIVFSTAFSNYRRAKIRAYPSSIAGTPLFEIELNFDIPGGIAAQNNITAAFTTGNRLEAEYSGVSGIEKIFLDVLDNDGNEVFSGNGS